MDCVICEGSKFVRLPVRHRASRFVAEEMMTMTIQENYRTYPCPECNAKTAAEEKVAILYADQTVRTYEADNPDLHAAVSHSLANILAERFLRDGYIDIRKESRVPDEVTFTARLGVVSPKTCTRIERRAIDKMKEFLSGVANIAAESIAVWGSHYTGNDGMISKGQAIDYMRAAFSRHMREVEDATKERSNA
ncbi:hypothetical protein [Rhizobium ruizarguesonis]